LLASRVGLQVKKSGIQGAIPPPDQDYCPFCFCIAFSASGVFNVPLAGVGAIFDAAVAFVSSAAFNCEPVSPIFSILLSSALFLILAAFLAAAFSSLVILASAALLSAASAFNLAWSSTVILVGVLSSASADTDAKANAAAINATSSLFTNAFSPKVVGCRSHLAAGHRTGTRQKARARESDKAQ